MNREIKFRAWDTKTKHMIATGFHLFGEVMEFGLIATYLISPENNPEGKGSLVRYNDVIITQFTGLKDKNGREIWEGDIIKAFTAIDNNELIDQVYFSEAQWELKNCCESLFNSLWDQNVSGEIWLEVIGNIFENPELIK